MLRIGLGVIAGFFAWAIVWFGSETILQLSGPRSVNIKPRFKPPLKTAANLPPSPLF